MNKTNQPPLGLKWTWHIFLLSNILMVLGVAITWIMVSNEALSVSNIMLPATICNLLSILGIFIFFYFDSKEIWLLKHHVPQKWIIFYFSSAFVFLFDVIFNFIFLAFYLQLNSLMDTKTYFLILIIFVSLFSIICIGLYRFGKYKIDYTIFLRKRGTDTSLSLPKKEPIDINKSTSSDPKASSKLLDRASKE